jgi:hypothetical protein
METLRLMPPKHAFTPTLPTRDSSTHTHTHTHTCRRPKDTGPESGAGRVLRSAILKSQILIKSETSVTHILENLKLNNADTCNSEYEYF